MERYQDLRHDGVTRAELLRRVRRGELVRVRRGAFRLPGRLTPEEEHLELIAATFPAIAGGAVLSHASAAVLHGLPVPAGALGRMHITRAGSSGKISRHVHRHGAALPEDSVVTRADLPVTGIARTIVDLARSLPYPDGVAVVDAGLRARVRRAGLLAELESSRGWPGNERARLAVDFGDGRAESPGESRSRVAMARLGLPVPELQREFRNSDGRVDARVDFDWEDYGVSGEFDGEVKYGRLLRPGQSVESVIRAERAREERLRRCGRWVIRWTSRDLRDLRLFERIIRGGLDNGLRAVRRSG